jgi:hypothetical protein
LRRKYIVLFILKLLHLRCPFEETAQANSSIRSKIVCQMVLRPNLKKYSFALPQKFRLRCDQNNIKTAWDFTSWEKLLS